MNKIRIFIADDHALMRVGLASMLNAEPDMEIIGEATNGAEAVRLVKELRPSVVIMDLQMPKLNGAEATRKIIKEQPETKVVILSSFGTSVELQQAIAYGAVAMQPKEDPTENLIRSIRLVTQGETVFPPEVRKMLKTSPLPPPLTERQAMLLQHVIQGLTDKQIADRLNISESGVKKHLKLIFAKLGATNRAEAAAIALQKHLLKV